MSAPLAQRLYRVYVALGAVLRSCLFFWGALFSSPIFAETPTSIDRNRAFPQEPEFYSIDDTQAGIKLVVEEMMGLFLVKPPRRHASEMTDINERFIHFHLWHPIAEYSNTQLWSKAASWLLLGRTKYAQGARALFSEMPSIQRITLSFHEVIRPGEEGRRLSSKPDQVYIYLTISLTRQEFEKIDLEGVRACATHYDCPESLKRSFSLVKFNTRHLSKRRR